MDTEHNIKLTSAEISQLWTSYINSTMSKCFFLYFLEKVEDTQIRPIIQHALDLAESHIQKLTTLFEKENWPVPHGFKEEEDVDIKAPRLFSDTFMLHFIQSMGEIALNYYSVSQTLAVRSDINQYYAECLAELSQFNTMAKDLSLSKGIFIRAPYINPPEKVAFVQQQSYMTGWLGNRRPLTAMEITNLYTNIQRNALGKATMIGFSQASNSKEVRKYMVRGKDISSKHIEIFGSILSEADLPSPMTWDTQVTASTTSPFSDKLMLASTSYLTAIGMGYYGTSLATCTRRDLSAHYVRLSAEIAKYAEDGANLMINNGWMEEPPLASDRDKLARQ
ncbi:DUF3231 family protein [Fictibacillus barbaricus]|uniref:DUF3231 family protein n=1 Tax=Fictibacillus barbaricus TaxID=182136 RepID=A0ABS2Z964_9BACL|nr:DUF3231 family protein [Fictibacillus barbaricus]MBN3543951.1 DUF3231 family protein [Fictibacillus barbaricus]GGB69895.1 hypothetical protein GCM10007199_40150 [Fictibacillus barbaricus]